MLIHTNATNEDAEIVLLVCTIRIISTHSYIGIALQTDNSGQSVAGIEIHNAHSLRYPPCHAHGRNVSADDLSFSRKGKQFFLVCNYMRADKRACFGRDVNCLYAHSCPFLALVFGKRSLFAEAMLGYNEKFCLLSFICAHYV